MKLENYYSICSDVRVSSVKEKRNTHLFPERERDISVFDHVLYLFPHREEKQHHPVEKKYWPENRYIKHLEECHHKTDDESPNDW